MASFAGIAVEDPHVIRRWLRRLRHRRRTDAAAKERAAAWLREHHPDERVEALWIRGREPDRTILAIILAVDFIHRGRPPHRLVAVDVNGVVELPDNGPYAIRGIK
ncbi:MAG TPA: hypothetical protein VHE35_04995 [Kofleriaceae bacterium]|nr:hypothetical protein [Kofleriaceae bacterium]